MACVRLALSGMSTSPARPPSHRVSACRHRGPRNASSASPSRLAVSPVRDTVGRGFRLDREIIESASERVMFWRLYPVQVLAWYLGNMSELLLLEFLLFLYIANLVALTLR